MKDVAPGLSFTGVPMSEFSHPLARDAKVWPSAGLQGLSQNILVVVTTLALDPAHGRHKADKIARLRDAARAWIEDTRSADEFVLVNRPRDSGQRGQVNG